jgi:hypothetical protein
MSHEQEFLTPVGRMVQGNCFKGRTKNKKGEPYVFKKGPNAGQPYELRFVAIAITKTDAEFNSLWAIIEQTAKANWPQWFDANGQPTHPRFSWKYVDGDSTTPDETGKRPCDREGWPGNHILKLSSNFPFPVYTRVNGVLTETVDPNVVKPGYFIRIAGSVKGNDSSESPGVYLNIGGVEFVGYGQEIRTGPDGEAMFGNAPVPALPAGASATPLAPATPPAGMTPGSTPGAPPSAPQGVPPGAGPGIPQTTPAGGYVAPPLHATPQAGDYPANTAAVRPVPSFVNPAPQATPAPAPVTTDQKYLVDGVVYTRAQLIQAKWTPEQIQAATPV